MRWDGVSVRTAARDSGREAMGARGPPWNGALQAGSDWVPTGPRHAAEVFNGGGPARAGREPNVLRAARTMPLSFEVLGPLRIVAPVDAGTSRQPLRERSLGGPKQRFVLARLLAEPN